MFDRLRKTAAALGLTLLLAVPAVAANMTSPYNGGLGPIEPANLLNHLNVMVRQINSQVDGLVGTLLTPATTSDTSADTLATVTLPGNTLVTGQDLRVKAYGVNSNDANVKTFTLKFGTSTLTQVVTGAAANWSIECDILVTGSKTETAECHGQEGTTVIASNQATNWTIDNTVSENVLITGTAATSGTMTLNGATFEQVK